MALTQAAHLETLATLHLNDCGIGDKGATALARTAQSANLIELQLDKNRIGDRAAGELARSSFLSNLRTLHLDHNRIGDKGATELARASSLDRLHELSLGENRIGDKGGMALFSSRTIVVLSFGSNPIGKRVVKKIGGRFGLRDVHIHETLASVALAGAPQHRRYASARCTVTG